MFDLPDSQTLYAALVARDASYDGRAYVGVSSTGIFCRLTCPARKPKFENCQFFPTPGACIEAGFRACKRCHPLSAAAGNDPMVRRLLEALEARPTYRWREEDVARMGADPSTIRRAFKRQFGMTFLEMARQRRLREGFTTLRAGEAVISAQLEAGFDSPSAFRAAFARLVGIAPAHFAKMRSFWRIGSIRRSVPWWRWRASINCIFWSLPTERPCRARWQNCKNASLAASVLAGQR